MGFIPVAISLMREVTPPRLTSVAVATMSATMGGWCDRPAAGRRDLRVRRLASCSGHRRHSPRSCWR